MRRIVKIENKPAICGILNITPDSFSDGGYYLKPDEALKRAVEIFEAGADFIDIGAESSRPGSDPVSVKNEIERILPALKKIRKKFDKPISVDTYKPEVADICLNEGADIINDITGFVSDEMINAVAKYHSQAIVMHMKGKPKNMQENPGYENVIAEIMSFFRKAAFKLETAGIKDIIVDPGIGFGKTLNNNLVILRQISDFKKLGYPVMIGTSRKSFIGAISGAEVSDRIGGTIASCLAGAINGADIVRVHDVVQVRQAFTVFKAIENGKKAESPK